MAGAGFCFLDPHGDASQHIASLAPTERRADVIYLDPSDPTHTFAYNPLSNVPEAERATAAANIVSAFKNIWANTWGARLEYILGNSLRLLLDTRDQTLLGLPRLLVDDDYRHWLVVRCQDPVVRAFWLTEYAAYDTRFRNEAIAPIQNKVGAFLANPFIRSILCQNSSTLKIPDAMNKGKVLIVNLSKGNLGTRARAPLGRASHHRVLAGGRGAPAHAGAVSAATSRCMSTNSKTSRPRVSHRSSRKRASGVCP